MANAESALPDTTTNVLTIYLKHIFLFKELGCNIDQDLFKLHLLSHLSQMNIVYSLDFVSATTII